MISYLKLACASLVVLGVMLSPVQVYSMVVGEQSTSSQSSTYSPPPQPTQSPLEKRCEQVTARLNKAQDSFANKRQKHVETLTKMREKIDSIIQKSQQKNKDVSKLKQNLTAWDAQVEETKTAYSTFSQELVNAKQSICGGKGVAEIMQGVRASLEAAKISLEKTRSLYQSTIKTDLETLKKY